MILEAAAWLFAIEILGFISFPVVTKALGSLPDRGYAASKIAGVMIFSYAVWLFSHAVGYNHYAILAALGVLAASFFALWPEAKIALKGSAKTAIKYEAFFLTAFVFFVLLRASMTPDINGLEKFSDMSRITGILQSSSMAPSDPWLSGNTMNYYYFGHFMVATMSKITGIPAGISFNLAVASLYALLALGVFSIIFNSFGNWRYAIIGVFVVVFMSNGFGAVQAATFAYPYIVPILSSGLNLDYPLTCCSAGGSFTDKLLHMSAWPSTRVVPFTINEFPYANFLFKELHPHAMALPFQILAVILCTEIILAGKRRIPFSLIVLASLVLAGLFMTNTWDYPAYAALLCGCIMIAGRNELVKSAKSCALVVSLSAFMALPYILTVHSSAPTGFTMDSTSAIHFLVLFPVFIVVIAVFYAKRHGLRKLAPSVIAALLIYAISGKGVVIFAIPLIYSGFLCLKDKRPLPHILVALGSLIALAPEFVFIDGRYNMIFKFYYHVWIMWGIASALLIPEILQGVAGREKLLIKAGIAVLVVSCSILTVFGTYAAILESHGMSLDGTAFMKTLYPFDYSVISYLENKANPDDVILEATGRAYTSDSVVSTFTGLSSVIGWQSHEFLWNRKDMSERAVDVDSIYASPSSSLTKVLLGKYGVKYIVVGEVEAGRYNAAQLQEFRDSKEYSIMLSEGSYMLLKVL
ncbi:MAG TPA: DUF2298 domain-containing protein [archaeon]|nr:DUF2298 domain-containing protein [archaeon]